jgi:hypothetical protein
MQRKNNNGADRKAGHRVSQNVLPWPKVLPPEKFSESRVKILISPASKNLAN